MDVVLLIARLVLASVFMVAGVAKLLDLPGSRRAAVDFGVPGWLAPAVAYLLPIAEIGTAVALVPTGSARWGALGALALLTLFIAGIAVSMAKGRAPDCHCFGQLHSEPAGGRTLARNSVLAAVAAFVAIAGWDDAGASVVGWLDDLSAMEVVLLLGMVVLLAAVGTIGWFTVGLLEQNGRLLLRMEAMEESLATGKPVPATPQNVPAGLPVGTAAPGFALPDLEGKIVTRDELRAAGAPVLLVFSDPGCAPCNQLLPEIARWQRELAGRLSVALVSRGARDANLAKMEEHGVTHVLLQQDRELANVYGSRVTPAAVLIRPDGTIGAPLAGGAKAVRALVSTATGAADFVNGVPMASANSALQLGDAVRSTQLESLDGDAVDLADQRDAVLLFWNPGCGYCQRMLGDVLKWEMERPAGVANLVVISAGSADVTREHGFRSMVLLDRGVGAGGMFGARGTPAAVRIDHSGRVASTVATGATAVLELMHSGTETSANGVVPSNGHRPAHGQSLMG